MSSGESERTASMITSTTHPPRTIIQLLDRLPAFHLLVRWLGLRRILRLGLARLPLVRSLPRSGVRYRLRHLETFFVADEIFARGTYTRAVDPERTRTFADLGSHVGLFAALLAHQTGQRNLQG